MPGHLITRERYEQAKANADRYGDGCCDSCEEVIELWERATAQFRQEFPDHEPEYLVEYPSTVVVSGAPRGPVAALPHWLDVRVPAPSVN